MMSAVHVYRKKTFLLATVLFTSFILVLQLSAINNQPDNVSVKIVVAGYNDNQIDEWFQMRLNEKSRMSDLGRMVFLNEQPQIVNKPKGDKFKILVWKYGSKIENRHLKRFSGDKYTNPYSECSVRNCDISYKDSDINDADIVIFHMHAMEGTVDLPPNKRNPNQIWAFLTDESPYHTFLKSHKYKMSDFDGVFNWSMSYRMDADIPVPYGRTVVETSKELNLDFKKRRDVLIAIMGSNCGGINGRWDYVKELSKHIPVHIYGGCGTDFKHTCPGHFREDCHAIDDYMFYLSFENSNCDEYITEKLWWNAFEKGAIPIVMGGSDQAYRKLLPPDSYINIADFASPKILADYVAFLNRTGDFVSYYRWRKQFRVLNEHGYFKSKSVHYCRICEALNYNVRNTSKVLTNMKDWWSVQANCHASWKDS
ncbi:3-galactosyl-N-acetylglucosaminide 4-alpha-L-fucosyltransferase FUT3 isoform X2 [Aethina tumida]|nr:3-galactosyl-N-acetylglucosaminide 4-alpha-L-fucosyltransferase FUT3 isoform X2 [Aethina tumida]